MSEATTFTFEYTDLNEVDPSFKPLDEGMYDLKVLKAELKKFQYKPGNAKGVPEGTEGQFVKLSLAVTNHDKYAGRRIFPRPLFPNGFGLRALRKIADATGVTQTPGEPVESWLQHLSEEQPVFTAMVVKQKDNRDPNNEENDINWREVRPCLN